VKHETRTMHLFAGHGGGLLADLILGHTPVVAVEWDSYACQVLRERSADGWFPGLRVWEGDVQLFDPSEYTGKVDCIHAGFPCQDISVAGKQAGVHEGTRSGLYREVLRIAGVVRPKQLFLENVSAILSNGLGTVLGDLAALGYDTRWLCIRASDVGAPHHRDRWFLLGHAAHNGHLQRSGEQEITNFRQAPVKGADILAHTECSPIDEQSGLAMQRGRQNEAEQVGLGGSGADVADTPSQRGNGSHDNARVSMGQQKVPESGNNGGPTDVADTECQRQQGQGQHEQSSYSTQGRDWQTVESEYGGSSNFWATEPNVGRVANGVPHRVHRLKGLGNAQVPLQAAAAYRLLGGL